MVVPARSGGAAGERLGDQIAALVRILLDRAFWRLAPLLAATAGGHIAIQTLWAGPWLRDIGGLDRIGVANHLMAMALGFMAGILISGAVADWLVRRGVDRLQVMLVLLLVFFVAELLIILETTSITLLVWVTFGMMGQVAILAYPWLASHYGAARSGRAQTAMNLLIFAAAFAAQATIGWIIDQFPATATGAYDPRGYQLGFGALLALQLLGLGWYLLPRRRA